MDHGYENAILQGANLNVPQEEILLNMDRAKARRGQKTKGRTG